MRTDEALMQDVASGSTEAFEEIVRRYRQMAIGIAYNLLKNSSRAEEIAQEAFLKILRNAEDYKVTASFKTYLTRVVTRICYDFTEKNKPLSFDKTAGSPNTRPSRSPLDETLDRERRQLLRHALNNLPNRQRTAIVLQSLEDFTYEEIADVMETTKKAVERLLSRAREKLSGELDEQLIEDVIQKQPDGSEA
ncbi:MAG: RNA polymerase sigma factor [bacterium]